MNARLNGLVLIAAASAALLAGCGAPTATLDLITVARGALASAKEAEEEHHAELARRLEAQAASLDAAFDADVRLAAAGKITDAEGKAVAFTPEWVIAARKGYAAARDLLAEQGRSAEAAHATRLDNLAAADEALDMASQLILQQWALSEKVRQELINVQRRLSHGK
jgi:hypothetical protein